MQEIQNVRTKDFIVKILSEKIILNEIPSGSELSQEELASSFNVSRIPIREALQILEKQGLVKRLSNRHIIISDLNPDNIQETFSFICNMEDYNIINLLNNDNDFYNFLYNWTFENNDLIFHERLIFYIKNNFIKNILKNSFESYLETTCKLSKSMEKEALLSKSIQSYLIKDSILAKENFQEYFNFLSNELINERSKNK